MNVNREELLLSIDEAEWIWLKAHLNRGGLILVNDSLDLADTALRVAEDDIEIIQELLESGLLGKPSESQIKLWDSEDHKKFSMLIISPYVLIQEKVPTFH